MEQSGHFAISPGMNSLEGRPLERLVGCENLIHRVVERSACPRLMRFWFKISYCSSPCGGTAKSRCWEYHKDDQHLMNAPYFVARGSIRALLSILDVAYDIVTK